MKIKWYLWILMFILVVLIFPKTCGRTLPSPDLIYKCIGFETPLIASLQDPKVRDEWCSGICSSKSIPKPKNESANSNTNSNMIGPISGISGSFAKLVPVLFLILGVIFIVNYFVSLKKKSGSGAGITIIRGPGE